MRRFVDWLEVARTTDDPAGDFVKDARDDGFFPDPHHLLDLVSYLHSRGACEGAVEAAKVAWGRYERWKQR